MFTVDDHTGNVVTTVALFVIAATILYIARGAFLVLLLSLLFAYLLEPAVIWVQQHSRLGRKSRTWASAQVYLLGTLVLGSVGYGFGPRLVAQINNLNATSKYHLFRRTTKRNGVSVVPFTTEVVEGDMVTVESE